MVCVPHSVLGSYLHPPNEHTAKSVGLRSWRAKNGFNKSVIICLFRNKAGQARCFWRAATCAAGASSLARSLRTLPHAGLVLLDQAQLHEAQGVCGAVLEGFPFAAW